MRDLRLPAIAAAVAVLVAACASPAPPPEAPPATPPEVSPAGAPTASDAEGAFRLDFSLPKASFSEAEAIEGLATLSLVGPGQGRIGASGGGPMMFGITEVGGRRAMGPAADSSCQSFPIGEGSPITTRITKSGGWSDTDPDAAFYREFFADPELHLPAGTWDITAYASFSEGDCRPNPHELSAPIRIEVIPAP